MTRTGHRFYDSTDMSHGATYDSIVYDTQRQWRTQEFFFGGVQQTKLRIEDRENANLGAVAP
jgi:hypothetical protein